MATDEYPIRVAGSGILGAKRSDRSYEVRRYDFRRPDKFSWDQIRTFEMMHKTIARLLAVELGRIVRRPIDVTVSGVDQMTYEEFLDATSEHSLYAVVEMRPLRGSLLVQTDGSLATLLIASVYGVREATLAHPARPLTELEKVVAGWILEDALPAVNEGWRHVGEVHAAVTTVESDRRMVMIVPPAEMIILASINVAIGDASAFINLAVPFLMLEPVLGKLSAMHSYGPARPPLAAPTMGEAAGHLTLDCELSIPAGRIPFARLPAILAGEPLPLPALADGGIELRGGGVPVARVSIDQQARGASRIIVSVEEAHAAVRGTQASSRSDEPNEVTARLGELTEAVRELKLAVSELREDQDAGANRAIGPDGRIGPVPRGDLPDAADAALLMAGEAPTTVAFYLAGIPEQSAAGVLSRLSPGMQVETLAALASLAEVDRRLHERMTAYLSRRLRGRRDAAFAGGPGLAAGVLNHVPRAVEKHVMETFQASDHDLFESIARLMFVFEDFLMVDPAAIAKLDGSVGPDEWALALKGVPGEVSAHILESLGHARAAEVHEEEASLGRVRRNDVEAAQREIIEELRRLEERGEVMVARHDEVVE